MLQCKKMLLTTIAVAPLLGLPMQTYAQTTEDDDDAGRQLDLIVVEARRRAENIQEVPVAVQAFNEDLLEAYATTNFADLNDLVSGLTIYADGPVQPSINLRGIQGNAINGTGDDAVSINIDGVAHSNSQIFRFGLFELEAVEVLKGPQALFFGKNSPGGIVAMRTKNPTDEFYTEIQAGYETASERVYGHAVVSGPLGENFGARAALRISDQDGFFDNVWGDGVPAATQPQDETGPDYQELMFIGTLQGEFDGADITIKGIHADREGNNYAFIQLVRENGLGLNPFDDVILNNTVSQESFIDLTGSRFGRLEEAHEYEMTQLSIDGNIDLNDNWSAHSITGWVDIDNFAFGNGNARPASAPLGLTAGIRTEIQTFSQELRFEGDYDQLRVMLGGFYDNRETRLGANVWLWPTFRLRPDSTANVFGSSWSAFGQLAYDLTDQIEISAGGRYTEEDRNTNGENLESFGTIPAGPTLLAVDSVDYTNFSPEISISWRPNDDMMFFANYKEGFKSGGFNASTLDRAATLRSGVPLDDSFLEENVDGFEAGAKLELFENTLRLNITGFYYDYSELQQSAFFADPAGGTIVRTVNAGSAEIRGVEADMLWLTPIEGLNVVGNLAFNDNQFGDYVAQCNEYQLWVDPTGCNVDVDGDVTTWAANNNPNVLVAGTGFDGQNREGQPLRRAPRWAGSFGVNYETSLANDMVFRTNGMLSFSGKYNANGENNPWGIQDAYAILNASLGLSSEDGGWQVDVIGRNLTDQAFMTTAYDGNGTGNPIPGAPAIAHENLMATRNAPRQIFLQLTLRPTALFD